MWYKIKYTLISPFYIAGADLAFFQGGGFDPSSTSRVAASRFFWGLFYEPRSGEPIFLAILLAAKRRAYFFFGYFTSREAASRFFWLFYEPRSGEPIFFFGYFTSREAASRFFGYFTRPRSGEPIFLELF